jgi:PAS domain S-box-containing protein
MGLTEDKDLFQTIFDSAPNGIALMQPLYDDKGRVEDFIVLLFNAYTLNWIGDIDYKGKLYSKVFPMVKETDILQKFIEVAETGIMANFECYYTGEGMRHWFRFTAVKQGELLVVTTEDVTEQKQAEIILKNALDTAEKQKRLYDSITNNTPDLVYVFDLNYRFTYANQALLNMWGKTAEDAIGRGLRENGYEEWHALMHEREIDEIVITKKSIRGIVSFPHAELGSRIYDYILVPVLNQDGHVEAIAGTTRDITDSKRFEERLQQSETSFRNMIDQTPAPTLVLKGDDLVIEQINQSMLQMIGFDEKVVGTPLLNLMPELADQYIWKQVMKVYTEGTPFDQWEVLVTHKRTGIMKDYYYNIAYRPLKEEGKITGMIQVAIDVTEQVTARKKLEEGEKDLRDLVLQSPTGICLMDASTLTCEIVNDKFVEIAGKPYESIINRAYWDIFSEAAPYYEAALKHVVETGKAFYANEVELMLIRHGKEENIYVTFVYEPMKDSNGSVKKIVVFVIDNSSQVQARLKIEESEIRYKILSETLEQQVIERTMELQRSNEDLQQFAHVASHDLKEPIRKIKTFLNRLEHHFDGKFDDTAIRFMERIHVATDRMFTMIDGVLAYSTTNAAPQKPELVNLNEVIKNIESDLEVTLQKTRGSIHYEDLPVLEGATVLLYQLFYNLINNSIKFAKTNVPPDITISSKTDSEGFANITLSDNGIGFRPDHATRIFETFTRLNPKDDYEGTGLGLSLCKKIAERHGGNIIAIGNLDKGATFIITLPLKQKEREI